MVTGTSTHCRRDVRRRSAISSRLTRWAGGSGRCGPRARPPSRGCGAGRRPWHGPEPPRRRRTRARRPSRWRPRSPEPPTHPDRPPCRPCQPPLVSLALVSLALVSLAVLTGLAVRRGRPMRGHRARRRTVGDGDEPVRVSREGRRGENDAENHAYRDQGRDPRPAGGALQQPCQHAYPLWRCPVSVCSSQDGPRPLRDHGGGLRPGRDTMTPCSRPRLPTRRGSNA